jgi:hypothetical protein
LERAVENRSLTRRLLVHGALWTAFVTALDAGTSWIMMTLRGVSAEGNATMKILFQNRDVSTLLTWTSQQYVYIDLIITSVVLYFLCKYEERVAPKWLRETAFRALYRVTIALTWFFALIRLYYGPPGNVISTLLPYGEIVSLAGAAVLFTLLLWLILSDMKLSLILRQTFRPGNHG